MSQFNRGITLPEDKTKRKLYHDSIKKAGICLKKAIRGKLLLSLKMKFNNLLAFYLYLITKALIYVKSKNDQLQATVVHLQRRK